MKRSKHSLSHYNLLTCNQGQLVPVGLVEVLPGDSFRHATSAFIRVAPLATPVMHPVSVRLHHWFVPHRLVWDDFADFITGGSDGNDASVFPTISMGVGGASVGSLADFLGVPPSVANLEVSALPFRAYQLIFNEFYRDQDLVTPAAISTASGSDSTTSTALQAPAWEKDYFTTARPWTQKGPDVTLPLGTSAPVSVNTMTVTGGANAGARPLSQTYAITSDGTAASSTRRLGPVFGSTGIAANVSLEALASATGVSLTGTADLTGATSSSINDLREAFALQRYEEARARYGSRFTEYLRYLGVKSSDARLQRPEYLGGGKQTIQFSEVLQTAPTTDGDPDGVGNLKGHGVGALRSNRYLRFFEEHGYVITLMSVVPKTMYTQGLARHWSREIKEDFWQRELERIGQQPVLNKELYAAHSSPDGTFGYQDRYDEYRRMESRVSGEFRTTLNDWHMARIFSGDPALNASFVTANPTDRVYQSTATDQLYCMVNHSLQARRLVSRVGTPAGLF